MDVDAAIDRIHDTIQACMNDGLLPQGMVTAWHLAASTIDRDGDEVPLLLSDSTSTLTQVLGLIELARVFSVDQVSFAWGED